jgi:ribose transport system substrate-binding protein
MTAVVMLATSAASLTAAPQKQRYVQVVFLVGAEFWNHTRSGMEDAAKLLGGQIQTVLQGSQEWNGVEQATVLDQVIGTKPTGILVTAADAKALVPGINRAMKAGIPVVTFDTDAPTSDRLAFVGTDNYQSGRVLGNYLGQLLKGQGKIAILTVVGPSHLAERLKGVQDVLKESYKGVTIAAVQDDKSQPEVSTNVTVSLLQAHPDLKAIISLHGQAAPGIVAGVRQAGKTPGKDVLVTGWDFPKETLDYIEKGQVAATVAQNPYAMGYWAMMIVYAKNHKATRRFIGSQVPARVDTGVTIITSKSVKDWR